MGDSQLRVVVSQSFGPSVQRRGVPVTYHWRWYYHVPSLALWAILALLLLGRRANWSLQAWTILIPVVLLSVIWRMLLALLGVSIADWEPSGIFVLTMAMSLAVVWLLGDWLARRGPWLRLAAALIFALGVGLLSCQLHFGSLWSDDRNCLAMCFSPGLVLLAMALGGVCCRGVYGPGRLLVWLALWMGVLAALAIVAIMAMTAGIGPQLLFMLLIGLVGSLFWAAIHYAITLPFVILAFKCPLYRDRLKGALRLKEVRGDEQGNTPFADDIPVSTEPTAKPVAIDDVVGQWSFYLDALSRTVILDFRPDGTFAQTIRMNQGDIQEHQGGSWRLEGSLVHLEGYHSAADGTPQSRTWWMVETPTRLRLFGGDDPKHTFPLYRVGGMASRKDAKTAENG